MKALRQWNFCIFQSQSFLHTSMKLIKWKLACACTDSVFYQFLYEVKCKHFGIET